jgi:glutaminyl-tRNA synthetase
MDFIEEAVKKSFEAGQKIIVRYPPEPNGYLHIGHAKAFGISYSMAKKYKGVANLRFDDTNPAKENLDYVENIKKDIAWLGVKWDNLFFASDYYEKLYEFAVVLIKKGLAYVDDDDADTITKKRGELGRVGVESKFRSRSINENLTLFENMRNGKYADGEKVLRAKIDMKSPNMNMRDPVMYKICREPHYRTGDKWCIYPLYDFAHPLSDYLEHISHSLCSLEFEDHRPLYNWYIENVAKPKELLPHQYEFSRLNIENVRLSKRYLKELVDTKAVDGWDDPKMPTLCGLRRRGVPPEAIMEFVASIGISKNNMVIPMSQFEFFVRKALDPISTRVSVVENPLLLKVKGFGEVYIDGGDYSDNPPPKYKRLTKDNVVQLYGGPKIRLTNFPNCEVTDDKATGVIQFVRSENAQTAYIRDIGQCLIDKDFPDAPHYQFIRKGYYCKDCKSAMFIKTIGLKEGY